jgi:hypothetical protein
VSKGMTSWSGKTRANRHDPDGGVRLSEIFSGCTVNHRREPDNGEFINVTSSRRGLDDRIEWGPTVSNMLIEVMRDERQADDPESMTVRWGVDPDAWLERTGQVLTDIDEGRIPTTLVVLRVDDAEVEFQAVPLGRWWGAGAILDDVRIQMDGRMVAFDGLSLVADPAYQET